MAKRLATLQIYLLISLYVCMDACMHEVCVWMVKCYYNIFGIDFHLHLKSITHICRAQYQFVLHVRWISRCTYGQFFECSHLNLFRGTWSSHFGRYWQLNCILVLVKFSFNFKHKMIIAWIGVCMRLMHDMLDIERNGWTENSFNIFEFRMPFTILPVPLPPPKTGKLNGPIDGTRDIGILKITWTFRQIETDPKVRHIFEIELNLNVTANWNANKTKKITTFFVDGDEHVQQYTCSTTDYSKMARRWNWGRYIGEGHSLSQIRFRYFLSLHSLYAPLFNSLCRCRTLDPVLSHIFFFDESFILSPFKSVTNA